MEETEGGAEASARCFSALHQQRTNGAPETATFTSRACSRQLLSHATKPVEDDGKQPDQETYQVQRY